MEVDPVVEAKPVAASDAAHDGDDLGEADSDDDDDEQADAVCMVPMADMLNARNGCNNVRLACFLNIILLVNDATKRPASSTKSTPSTCVQRRPLKQENRSSVSCVTLQSSRKTDDKIVEHIWRSSEFRAAPRVWLRRRSPRRKSHRHS
jgi:hypothetical protein